MKINKQFSINSLSTVKDLARYTEAILDNMIAAFSRMLSFRDNIQCQLISVTFPTPNVDVIVSHGLGLVPTGYLILTQSVAMSIYTGSLPMSATKVFLRSSAAGTATIALVI